MTDPFKIPGPALISFSGGRTSGLMLRRCADAGLDTPELAEWWIGIEALPLRVLEPRESATKVVDHVDDPAAPMLPLGAEFLRYDAPRYRDLLAIAQQPMLELDDAELDGVADDDIGDCVCNAA